MYDNEIIFEPAFLLEMPLRMCYVFQEIHKLQKNNEKIFKSIHL